MSPQTPVSRGRRQAGFCFWASPPEPSPEASGPPGGFPSFRAKNEPQDHLPGHPGESRTLSDTRSKVTGWRPRKGVCAGPLGQVEEIRRLLHQAAACLPTPSPLCMEVGAAFSRKGPLMENLPSQPVLSGARERIKLLEAAWPLPKTLLSPRIWSFSCKGSPTPP